MTTDTKPRIALSDRDTAISLGRTLADVRVELPAGHDALPPRIRSAQFRDAMEGACARYDAFLERSA